jgi:aconitate hydratase
LRTTPRNFPGRSGNKDDSVFLCSPETATAAALTGQITDPRSLGIDYVRFEEPDQPLRHELIAPPLLRGEEARRVKIVRGPNITALPPIEPIADSLEAPVLLKVGDNLSTDTISPAGARGMQYRSNVQKIAELSFDLIDESYVARARAAKTGHVIVAGENYGQGSSREHAALAPRYLGLVMVVAKSFARIHWQNLVNAGILPLTFVDPADYETISQDDLISVRDLHAGLKRGFDLSLAKPGSSGTIPVRHSLSPRQVRVFLAGGLINWLRQRPPTKPEDAPTRSHRQAAA